MATVWRATDNVLHRQVAIKRLAPHLAEDPGAAARFLREARAAASLNHPGIVTVYDTGVDDEGPYLVLELIDGETLGARLGREGAMSQAGAARIIGETAAALDHAHSNGIVHRDIKPSNVMIDGTGRVRITDFGIARAIEDTTTLTNPANILGTVAYMAPEVLEGGSATPASDIYSLGAVGHEMLTGSRPFAADSIEELAQAIRAGERRPMPGVDEATEAAVARAMSVDADERPQTATALFDDLMASTTLPLDRAAMVETAPVVLPRSSSDDPTLVMPRSEPEARDRRWVWLAGLGGLLTIALLSAALFDGTPRESGGTTIAPATTSVAPTTSTSLPNTTTTSLPATTTTSVAFTAEAVASSISSALAALRPPEFKPKEVRKVEEALVELMEAWSDGDREDIAEELRSTNKAASGLPKSPEREELLQMVSDLAEIMGFRLQNSEGD